MYGEPSRIREVAVHLERRAEQLRREADALVAAAEQAPWVSLAADRMRERAVARRVDLLGVARGYDDAADAVRRHAAEVERLLQRLAAVERRVRSLVEDARDRVREAGGVVEDLLDGRLLRLPLPPPGHREWLDLVEVVPGVDR